MRSRQKLWPKILLTIILWLGFFYLVFSTSPDQTSRFKLLNYNFSLPLTKIGFFTSLLLSLTLTLGLILKSTKKAFALSFGMTIFLILKMLQLINWLNILLLVFLVIIMFLA